MTIEEKAEEMFNATVSEPVESDVVVDNINIADVTGDVSNYQAREYTEPERKAPLGKFTALITEAFIHSGTSQKTGKPYAMAKLVCAIDDLEVYPNTVRATYFLGKETPKFPKDYAGTQTELFIDIMTACGLTFTGDTIQSKVESLSAQKCCIRSYEQKQKGADGKKEVVRSDAGYAYYECKLIEASKMESLPEEAPF